MNALLIADDKPGHFHQAEGVLAAIARLRPIETRRLSVRRRFWVPTRMLHQAVNSGTPASLVLRLGYGIDPHALPAADIVVSAGGETLAANAAVAKVLGVPNIFCGRLRRVSPEHVQVVVVSLERFRSLPNHLVTLPPSPFEVDRPSAPYSRLGTSNPPRLAGALIGGNSGAISYRDESWQQLLGFLRSAHLAHGVRWLVTNSRRTPDLVSDALAAMASDPASGIDKFIDYRTAGAGTLAEILRAAEAIVVTADSTTMISEAVAARLPVIGVLPEGAAPEEREVEYRNYLAGEGWYRSIELSRLTPDRFLDALGEIMPRRTSATEELAAELAKRLPKLFNLQPAE